LLLALGALCGCGSSSQKVLYVVGLGTPVVAIFAVSGSGQITAIDTVNTGSAPGVIAIDPLARFAYILDSAGNAGGAGGVSQYVVARKTGALTVATFSTTNGTAPAAGPAETGVSPRGMVVDNSGNFVFVANQGAAGATMPACQSTSTCPSVSVYAIDQVGGTVAEIKQLTTAVSLLCTPNQQTPCPLPVSGVPTALATTGTSLFVGATSAGAGSISTYTFKSGRPPSPPTCPNNPGCLQTTAASTIAAGTNPGAMALDPTGKFLFVADPVANTVTTFSIGDSGQLTKGNTVAAGTTPVSIRVHPSGKFLYTANQGSNDVSAFSIDNSGTLTPLSGSPFAAQSGPSSVTTDSSGGLLFVAERDANRIAVLSIDSGGALKPASGSPFGPIPVITPVGLASIN
jgi:6-phosphogluconolactonase (cycloisomerase 2 family)